MLLLTISLFAHSYDTNEWNLVSQPFCHLMHKMLNATKGFPQCAHVQILLTLILLINSFSLKIILIILILQLE